MGTRKITRVLDRGIEIKREDLGLRKVDEGLQKGRRINRL